MGTIGHVDHGKTTLTSALTAVASRGGCGYARPFESLDKGLEERRRGVTIENAYCEFETERFHYVHVDCPGHADYVDEMIAGAAQMNAAILVVSAVQGPMPQTGEHVLLAKQAGVAQLVGFLSMMDRLDDPQDADIAEELTRELLAETGVDTNSVPFVRGSARLALEATWNPMRTGCIHELLARLDEWAPPQPWDNASPFLMPVNETFVFPGRGSVLTGRIDRGSVSIGDRIAVVGRNGRAELATVKQIESFRRKTVEAFAGDLVGILVSGVTTAHRRRGRVAAAPDSTRLRDRFWAALHIVPRELGGRAHPIRNGYEVSIHFRTATVTGRILLPKRHRKAPPGDRVVARIQLFWPVILERGWTFSGREGGRTVLLGTIQEFL